MATRTNDNEQRTAAGKKNAATAEPVSSPNLLQHDSSCSRMTNIGDDNHYEWLALLSSVLRRRKLRRTDQTPESARKLVDAGLLGSFTAARSLSPPVQVSPVIEATLMESFLEGDYDDKSLHLTTLDDLTKADTPFPVGLVFWRELSAEEVRDWIHWENLRERLMGEAKQQQMQEAESPSLEDDKSPGMRMRRSLKVVKRENIRWLEVAAAAQ